MKFITLLLFPLLSIAQTTLSGKIVNSSHQAGIPYVNIGIPNKNLGTVSDEVGNFEMEVGDSFLNDTISISSLGFETIDIPVFQFKDLLINDGKIALNEKPIELNEVVLSNRAIKEKVVGNTTTAKKTRVGFRGASLGHEVGMKVNVKKGTPMQMRKFRVNVLSNTSQTAKFRLNFYDIKEGLPGEKIVRQNIIFSIDLTDGMFTLDLDDYNVVIDQDFYFTLELIEDLGHNDEVFFSANLLGKAIVYRETSQAAWEKSGMVGVGMSLTAAY